VIFGSHIIGASTAVALASLNQLTAASQIHRMFIDQDTGVMTTCKSPLTFRASGFSIMPPGLAVKTKSSQIIWGRNSATLEVSREIGCKYDCAVSFIQHKGARAICYSKGKV
jgi:hypothetical protein